MHIPCVVVSRKHSGEVHGTGILSHNLETAGNLGLGQPGLGPKLTFDVLTNRPPRPREVP